MRFSIVPRFAAPLFLGITLFAAAAPARKLRQIVIETKPAKASAPFPFEPAEELRYEAFFSKLLLRSVSVAELSFKANRAATASTASSATGAREANLRFTMEIASKGIVPRLFGLSFYQRVESLVDPASFAVLQTTKLDEQNERRRTSEAVFDRSMSKVIWTERNPNDPLHAPRVVTSETNGEVQDIASVFYFLRSRKLVAGQSFAIPMSDSGRIFSAPVKVLSEKKRLKTALGEFSTVRVDVEIFGKERLLPGDGSLSIWFTNDARRIPLQARAASSMGTLDIKIKARSTGNNS